MSRLQQVAFGAAFVVSATIPVVAALCWVQRLLRAL
jgi:hypothetical protein